MQFVADLSDGIFCSRGFWVVFKLWAVPIAVALIGAMMGGPVVGLLAGIFCAMVWPSICAWREERTIARLTAEHLSPPPPRAVAEREAEQARQDSARRSEQEHQEFSRQKEIRRQERKARIRERNRLIFSHPMDYCIGGIGLFGIWLIFYFALAH